MRSMHRATGLPSCISFRGHFTALQSKFGDPSTNYLPQNARSHTRIKFQSILAALFENQKGNKSDPKFHGEMSEATKKSLAERLAARLGEVLDAGRHTDGPPRTRAARLRKPRVRSAAISPPNGTMMFGNSWTTINEQRKSNWLDAWCTRSLPASTILYGAGRLTPRRSTISHI